MTRTETEQAGTSNGGQRLSLNSGFHSRRGWPRRSAETSCSGRYVVFLDPSAGRALVAVFHPGVVAEHA
jgi:hypothetical protein